MVQNDVLIPTLFLCLVFVKEEKVVLFLNNPSLCPLLTILPHP